MPKNSGDLDWIFGVDVQGDIRRSNSTMERPGARNVCVTAEVDLHLARLKQRDRRVESSNEADWVTGRSRELCEYVAVASLFDQLDGSAGSLGLQRASEWLPTLARDAPLTYPASDLLFECISAEAADAAVTNPTDSGNISS